MGESAELLMNLRGTLIMVPQMQASDIARACSNILQKHVDASERPSEMLLDALAEALSGVEYFIERLDENVQHSDAEILVKAREVILPYMASQDLELDSEVLSDDAIEQDDLIEIDLTSEMQPVELEQVNETVESSHEEISLELPEGSDDAVEEISLELPQDESANEEITLADISLEPLLDLSLIHI